MKNEKCGIPVREWILGFFTIWLGKSCINLFKILVMHRCYEKRVLFSFCLFISVNGLLIIWVVLGNVWYFSEENDCDSKS